MEKEMSFTVDTGLFRKYVTIPLVTLEPKDEIISLLCKKDCIKILESNTQNVLRINVTLNNNILEDYENNFEDDEQVELNIKITDLDSSLQNLSGKSKFVLDSKKQKLNVSSGMYKYTLGLHTKKDVVNFPNLKFNNNITLKGADFFTIIDKSSKINNLLSLEIKANVMDETNFSLYITASKQETNDGLVVEIDRFDMRRFNIKNECSTLIDSIGTDFLNILKVTVKDIEEIKLNLGNDYPLLIEYNIKENKGIVKLMLAPRVDGN